MENITGTRKQNNGFFVIWLLLLGCSIMTQSAMSFSITNNNNNRHRHCCARLGSDRPSQSVLHSSSDNNDSTPSSPPPPPSPSPSSPQAFLDKAAQIRAEIAAMEGKTLEEVEAEARVKKEEENERRRLLAEEEKAAASSNNKNTGRRKSGAGFVEMPGTPEQMVQQASVAVERAYRDGITRQTVRFALVKEDEYITGESNEWPGGAQQIYREAGRHLTTALLKELRLPTTNDNDNNNNNIVVMPPTIKEKDIWDFDGSALHTAESSRGPEGDIQALVFPNTDTKYTNDIEAIDEGMGSDRLFLLVNPFWRNLESWGFNLLAPNAKNRAKEVIFDRGYDETYVLNRYSVRGENCAALRVYPYDWQLFAFREDDYNPVMESAIRLGSSEEEPTSQLFTKLLNERPEFKDTRNIRQMKKIGRF